MGEERHRPRRRPPGRRSAPLGLTMVELLVALVIVALAIAAAAVALGSITSARTREAAGKLATAVRYAYHLAAVNNKVYALYLDLDNGTYHTAPAASKGECERLLLRLDGKSGDGPIVSRVGDQEVVGAKWGRKDRRKDEEPMGAFDLALGGAGGDGEDGAPDWVEDDTSAASRLVGMLSRDVRHASREEARRAGVEVTEDEDDPAAERGRKKIKTFRKNALGRPARLPDGVSFGGVVLQEGGEPVTSGVVPILVYPHGYVQRAFIYVTDGKEKPEEFTVEVLSLQARGVIHDHYLHPRDFKEEVDR